MTTHLFSASSDPENPLEEAIEPDFLPTLKLLMKYHNSKMMSDASHCQVLHQKLNDASQRISLASIRQYRESKIGEEDFYSGEKEMKPIIDIGKSMDFQNNNTLQQLVENQSIDQKTLNRFYDNDRASRHLKNRSLKSMNSLQDKP